MVKRGVVVVVDAGDRVGGDGGVGGVCDVDGDLEVNCDGDGGDDGVGYGGCDCEVIMMTMPVMVIATAVVQVRAIMLVMAVVGAMLMYCAQFVIVFKNRRVASRRVQMVASTTARFASASDMEYCANYIVPHAVRTQCLVCPAW